MSEKETAEQKYHKAIGTWYKGQVVTPQGSGLHKRMVENEGGFSDLDIRKMKYREAQEHDKKVYLIARDTLYDIAKYNQGVKEGKVREIRKSDMNEYLNAKIKRILRRGT